MTEFGNRIKAWRDEKGLTQPEACSRLFPATHGASTNNAKAVHISQIESGRTIMQQSSPDFVNVMRILRVEEEDLLKLLHAGQRDIRARARGASGGDPASPPKAEAAAASASNATKAIDETLARIAGLSEINIKTSGGKPRVVRPAKRKTGPVGSATVPVKSEDGFAANGLETLGADLSYIMQKRSLVEQIRNTHHQTMGEFVKRVIGATLVIGQNDSGDIGLLAEDLSRVMQKRSQSAHISAMSPQVLGDFVRRVVNCAVKLQDVS